MESDDGALTQKRRRKMIMAKQHVERADRKGERILF